MRDDIGNKPESNDEKNGITDTEILKVIVGKLFVY